ncbi:MAG: putative type pilus secretin PilQ [Cyanobacteria bacterium RYN_339]|nr:putative type pilus secretin PilQ [Cyanobacteria bacterium RYN_339]
MTRFAWLVALLASPLVLTLNPPPSTAADPADAKPLSQMVHVPGGEQRVTLRLRQLDLGDALRLIAQRAHLSINVASDVKGKVDFDFYNERLNRILEIILVSNNLHMRQVGSTYLITATPPVGYGGVKVFQINYASADSLSKVLANALNAAGIANADKQLTPDIRSNTIVASGTDNFVNQVGTLVARLDRPHESRVFRLNYVKAEDMAKLLTDGLFFGANGTGIKFVPILRDNSLMVVASPEDVRLVSEVIQKLDRRLRQVLIEVKLIELNGTANNLLGVTFDAQTGTLTGSWNSAGGMTVDYNPIQEALSQLRVRVNALVRDNKARLLASPQIIAMDSKESKLEITDDIIEKVQTETTTNANTSISRQNVTLGTAGITLALTPKINPDGYISMKVEPTISFIRDTIRDSRTTDIIATLKSQRKLTTPEVRVRDGETLIIGGLNQERVQENVDKFPLLGDLPFLGAAFRRTDVTKVTTELVVLITPKLVPEGAVPPPSGK